MQYYWWTSAILHIIYGLGCANYHVVGCFCPCTFEQKLLECTICMMKRARLSAHTKGPEAKKRTITYSTYRKWKQDFDQDYQMVTWLDCNKETEDDKEIVTSLKCIVCTKFKETIKQRINFIKRAILETTPKVISTPETKEAVQEVQK